MAWEYDKQKYKVPAPVAEVGVTNPRTSQQLTVDCLVDTGSDACWLRKSDIDALGPTKHSLRFSWVPDSPGTVHVAHRLALQVWGRTFQKVWVMELPPKSRIGPVLGRDVLNKLVLTLKGPDRGYEVEDGTD